MNEMSPSPHDSGTTTAAGTGAQVSFLEVGKRYGPMTALRPTTLEIASGEFFAILGPSGSGKSTLLGVTAGFIPPTVGHILVNGLDLIGIAPYRRNIGMVFQNYSLFPHMTVAQNIAFPLRMRRLAASEVKARVGRMLEMVRLAGLEDRRPHQLSGGQQQRVALARAAVYDPLLLLMDEPLGALDKNLREEMQEEIRQFQAALGTTVLYVTHDQHEAACMASRIAIMNAGRVVQVGTPRELYERPGNRFVASFLGEANIMPVRAVHRYADGIAEVVTEGGLKLRAAAAATRDGSMVACVRPENLRLSALSHGPGNVLQDSIVDTVYTAGSVRYRIRISESLTLTHRLPSTHGMGLLVPGDPVTVSWKAEDMLLLPES